ncbi:MAG: family acetyltransferase [Herbinix sp.]|nr:family acetyltransferase [Herbinix sp.]
MDILETDRLIIRRFIQEDWKALYEYLSKEEVVKFEPYGVHSEDECKEEALRRSSDFAFWAVCLKDSNKLIGNLYFCEQNPSQFHTWELGYVFNNDFQGNGYATEACARLIKYGFECLKVRRIVAKCNPLNTNSWKLLERLKLRREGHSLQTVYFKHDQDGNPIWNDTFAYAMLRTEWISSNREEM